MGHGRVEGRQRKQAALSRYFLILLSAISLSAACPPAFGAVSARTDREIIAGAYRDLRAGNFDKGIIILKAALKASPGSSELKGALAEGLNAAAVSSYNKGDFIRAKDLLNEATTLSTEPDYLKNLAKVKLRLNDVKGAMETLSPYASSPEIRTELKGLYIRLGNESKDVNLKDAIEYYGKALELDPGDGPLKEVLVKLRSEYDAEASMGSAKMGHFLVKFEGEENLATANVIAILLEEAYGKVGADLDYYPDDRIEALLYSKERFMDITRSPSWVGAIYDGRIKIPAGGITEKTALLEKTILHEYTHAVVRRLSKGRAPVWLNEGMAQYEDGSVLLDHEIWLKKMAVDKRMDLRSLEGSFMGLSAADSEKAYAESLSATRYIIREYGTNAVRRIFVGLADGLTLDQSIQAAIGLSYDLFEESWMNSLKR